MKKFAKEELNHAFISASSASTLLGTDGDNVVNLEEASQRSKKKDKKAKKHKKDTPPPSAGTVFDSGASAPPS